MFVEVYQLAPILLIVGGGHIGQPLAEMARIVGFNVQVVDVRPERATVPQLDPVAINPWTYVVFITEDHVTDEQALRQVLDTPAAYFDHLRAESISEEQLARAYALSAWT